MNSKFFTPIKSTVLTMFILLAGFGAKATTYTAVVSGAWSSTVTWGGTAPGTTIGGTDVIVIPVGITVDLDNSVVVNSALATLSVSGTLSTSNNSNITLNSGSLTGNGTISVSNFTVGSTGTIAFSGTLNSSTFTTNQTLLNLTADVNVSSTLFINGGVLQVNSGGSFNLANNATVNINNGSISLNGGLFGFLGMYNVIYSGGSGSLGTMFSTGILNNLTVSLSNSSDDLDLNGNINVTGNLSLTSGSLNLNGYDLTISGSISSTGGTIISTSSSNIVINTTTDPGNISFSGSGYTVGNFTVNMTGNNNSLDLSSNLIVNGGLTLTSGNLNLQGSTLTLNSGFTSSGGTIGIGSSSGLVLNGSGNWGTIPFMGTTIGNLSINLSGSGSVNLNGSLTVAGTLSIADGTLMLNGNDLTVNGSLSGSGFIYGDTNSNLSFNGSGNSYLNLSASSQTIHNFDVNLTGGGTLALNSNLIVDGQLYLQNGSFALNGNDITLNGTVVSTNGSLSGNVSSDIIVNGTGSIGNIGVTGNSNSFGNLVINIGGSNGSINLDSDVIVTGTLQLTSGIVNTGSNNLIVAASGMVQGGSSSSYVVSNITGHLMMHVNTTSSTTFNVGTMLHYAPVVVTNNSSTSGNFGVNAFAGVFADGFTGTDISSTQSTVNTSWDVVSDINAGLNANLEFYWNTGMEVNGFDHNMASIAHYTGGSWDVDAFVQASAHGGGSFSLTRTGLTSLSPFAVFDNATITSVKENVANAVINVYPNPTADMLNVSLTEPNKYKRLRMFDVAGKEMASVPVNGTITNIDLSGLPSGTYFLSIDGVYTQQIIKR